MKRIEPDYAIKTVNIVKRTMDTRPLKEIGVLNRRRNLKNAFKIDKSVVKLEAMHKKVSGTLFSNVLIVDDIFTTGATIDTISELLKADRITKGVYALCPAIGSGDDSDMGV